ncbi:MAG TPA: carboxypeptidase-like regulatory domain-containing protein [Thermoanaerobaculia bacterium]|jgi:hypothetical protein|nr:carboxypeptidase-like regulatory domain-containing protein [Thermoanaerobaculia bacterium]
MARRLLVVLIVLTAATLAARAVTPPDLRSGNVNGLRGILFWPADPPAPSGDPRPLETAEGCDVHLVPLNDLDREFTYPCGKWFALPSAGQYNHWLEADGRMTPAMGMLSYGRRPFEGVGMAAISPLAPAGRVVVPRDRSLADTEGLRLVSIESRHAWGSRVFDRRVAAANVHKPVQMPEGRILVGRFDRKTNEAVALSKPIEITADRTAEVWPVPPIDSDVFVVLSKTPEMQLSGKPVPIRLALDSKRAPDVLLNGFDRVLAVWYGVAARHATISLQSDAAFWPAREIDLTRGKVTTIRAQLQKLPDAHVSITVPAGVTIAEKLRLEVSRAATKELVRSLPVAPGRHDLNALPAETLTATLHVGEWTTSELLDLSSGEDAKVNFDLQPIAVTGTVFHGKERAAAEIEFLNEQEWRRVQTNERGEYATTFWWPKVHTARVTIAGGNQPPYLDAFREILQSGTVDFHVPRTDYVVHVRDAATGRGIAGAQVIVGNDATNKRTAAQRIMTDDAGAAVLPPLDEGELYVGARADHYAPSERTMIVDDQHHDLEVVLKPLRTAGSLQLRLHGGAPAAQAEAWAFDAAMKPLWRGVAGNAGSLELPDVAAGAVLLVRHAQAASTVRVWTPAAEGDPDIWTLDPPAEPLTVVAKGAVAGASVALWLDGVRLSGPPLSFATWSLLATNRDGIWTGRNLPPKSVRLLLLPPAAATSNAFDAIAQRIDYPWPTSITAPVSQ